jgi:hypothetical protein
MQKFEFDHETSELLVPSMRIGSKHHDKPDDSARVRCASGAGAAHSSMPYTTAKSTVPLQLNHCGVSESMQLNASSLSHWSAVRQREGRQVVARPHLHVRICPTRSMPRNRGGFTKSKLNGHNVVYIRPLNEHEWARPLNGHNGKRHHMMAISLQPHK